MNLCRSVPLLALVLLTSLPVFGQKVISMRIDGMINPAAAEYVHEGVQRATAAGAECLLIQLNTPGGLLKSTRMIVSDELESRIPVIVFVSPGGAHAGSAGVFLTLAAHIAAMAPGTNIGAAHPVAMQGQQDTVMNEKATNDAAAFIRTIAEKRKRNLAWAEEAVRRSISITETEALNTGVIDLVAKNVEDLLNQVDGRKAETAEGAVILHTKNAHIESLEMRWTEKILDLLSDPNIAYILFMLGLYGLLFELYNPGSIFPGIVGVISLILAFYSMHTLPINYAGVALILFAIVLFVLELKLTSHGLLAVGGVVSLLLGSMMLVRTQSTLEFVEVSWSVIIAMVALSALFFTFVIGLGLKAQLRKPTTGVEGLIGEIGEAVSALDPQGTIRVRGELWQAESTGEKVLRGRKVRVVEVRNLTLRVEPQP